jgi:hypothetical protein
MRLKIFKVSDYYEISLISGSKLTLSFNSMTKLVIQSVQNSWISDELCFFNLFAISVEVDSICVFFEQFAAKFEEC